MDNVVVTGVLTTETMGMIVPISLAVVDVTPTELTIVSVNRIFEHISLMLNTYLYDQSETSW